MKPGRRRSRFGRRAARTLAASGVALGAAAVIGGWAGFGWVSGPAAIGALGAVLLAFALFSNLPTATEGNEGSYVPNVSGNTDNE